MTTVSARLIEELSLNAWPALETVFLDGWVLRFANDYTRRANSVNPLYPGAWALDDKLGQAEELYRRRGLRPVFKITPASEPAGIDQALAERGYAREAPTSVQIADLNVASGPTASGRSTLAEALTDEWLAAAYELIALPERHRATLRQMLALIVPPVCFAALNVDGQTVSCGQGVLQAGCLGLFDIITRGECRNRGYARQVVNDLLARAREHGGHTAYLQVMLNNAPALHLYETLGFRETYQYWYRVKG